ncbi:MAG: hypothetical protein WCT10_04340 [Patescibacteria group bacterium]|jgi:hypothetical protein
MPDNRNDIDAPGFNRESFIKRMIPILSSSNMEIGTLQLVDILSFPELSDLAWAKLLRHSERLPTDILCQVVMCHARFRFEAASLLLFKNPSVDQLCCVYAFVPEFASMIRLRLALLGYQLP